MLIYSDEHASRTMLVHSSPTGGRMLSFYIENFLLLDSYSLYTCLFYVLNNHWSLVGVFSLVRNLRGDSIQSYRKDFFLYISSH